MAIEKVGTLEVNWDSIVAKPLVGNDFTNVKPKNPNLSFYYAYTGGNPPGTRISQLEAVGFRVATPVDCEVPGLKARENKWINGDLLLLCIAKADYLGALKYNSEVARSRTESKVAAAKGIQGMTSKMFGKNKLAFHQPSSEEKQALFNDEILHEHSKL